MTALSDEEMDLLVTFHMGGQVPDELLQPALAKMDPSDEETSLELGRRIMHAVKEHRRAFGGWPPGFLSADEAEEAQS